MDNKRKILVTLPYPAEWLSDFETCVRMANAQGYEVVLAAGDLSEDELMPYLPDVYGAVCSGDCWTEKAIKTCSTLRVLSRMGVGYDRIDMAAADRHNVCVTITRGANSPDVAEYTLSLILAAARRIFCSDSGVRRNEWPKVFGHSLYGKTLGIVGFGNIGRKLATLVRGFDMQVLTYSAHPDQVLAEQYGVHYVSFDELMRQSDVISVHLPLLPSTRGLIGREAFASMKKNVIIVNCARGGIIDEAALIDAIDDGTVFAAALDVFEEEPLPPDSPLRDRPEIILSPHTAGLTYEGRGRLVKRAFQNALDVLAGKLPDDAVNSPRL